MVYQECFFSGWVSKLKLVFAFLLFPLIVFGQTPATTVVRIPTSAVLASNAAVKLKFDSQGALYLAGQANDGGLYVAKYAANGDQVWAQHQTSGITGAVPQAICVDGNGGFYATCACSSDWVTLAYGPDGTPKWTNWVNGQANGDDVPHDIAVDNVGNVYVVGSTFVLNAPTVYSYVVNAATMVSYDAQGDQLWRTDDEDQPYSKIAASVISDNLGHVFATEQTFRPDHNIHYYSFGISAVGPPNGAISGIPVQLYRNGLLWKVSSVSVASPASGVYGAVYGLDAFAQRGEVELFRIGTNSDLLWQMPTARITNMLNCGIVSMGVDPQGGVCFAAQQTGLFIYDTALISKFAADGTPLWTNILNGVNHTTSDQPRAMVVDGVGASILTGVTADTNGVTQCFTVKYADDGLLLWAVLNGASTNGIPSFNPQVIGLGPQNNVEVVGFGAGQNGGAMDLLLMTILASPEFAYVTNNGAITITKYVGPGGTVFVPGSVNGLPVMSIGDGAFSDCTNLLCLGISQGITGIGANAFSGCTGLTNVSLGKDIVTLGNYAFYGCSNLAAIVLPGGVAAVGTRCFGGCSSLRSFTIPASVSKLGNGVFSGCPNLKAIYFDGNAPTMTRDPLDGSSPFIYDLGNPTIYFLLGTTGWGAVWYQPAKLSDPQRQFTYESAPDGSFSITGYIGMDGIIAIPSVLGIQPVTTISENAFNGCSNLNSVVVSNGITHVGNRAFQGCWGLTNVTIGASVIDLGVGVFSDCANLNVINFAGNCPNYGDGVLSGDDNAVVYYSPQATGWGPYLEGVPTSSILATFTTNNGSVTITHYFGSEDTVSIPGFIAGVPVTKIGSGAFRWHSEISTLTLPSTLTDIADGAFFNCDGLLRVTIPVGVTNIGNSAFWTVSRTKAVFVGNAPQGDASIFSPNADVYYNVDTTGWTTASWTTNYKGFDSQGLVYSFDNGSYNVVGYNGPGGAITIPSAAGGLPVAGIECPGLSYCNNLTSVTIAEGITDIGRNCSVFAECGGLTNVIVPNSVTNIGFGAFDGCGALRTVTIGKGLASMSYPFDSCSNLTDVFFRGGPPSPVNYLFVGSTPVLYYLTPGSGWGTNFAGRPVLPAAPVIDGRPVDQACLPGGTATFGVLALGHEPLSYQWFENGQRLTNSDLVIGAMTANLSIVVTPTNVPAGFAVVVSNAWGSVTSSIARLALLEKPTLVTQPINQTNVVGTTASFHVEVAGSLGTLTYQWFKSGKILVNDTRVAGVGSADLTITGVTTNDAGEYSVVISNAAGAVNSAVARLDVVTLPGVVSQPAAQTNIIGTTATFNVSASGTGPLSFQWFKNGAKLVNDSRVSGVASATLKVTGVKTNDAGNYSVVVSNAWGSASSSAAVLTVVPDRAAPSLGITSHLNLQAVNASKITLAGTASDAGFGDNGVASVTVNGVAATNGTALGSGVARWSRSVSISAGTNLFVVVAADTLGNSVTNRIAIIGDSTKPTMAVTNLVSGQRCSNSVFTVAGTAGDKVAVANVRWQLNGGIWNNAVPANGRWSAVLALTATANTLKVYATDSADNCSATNTINFTYVPSDVLMVVTNGQGTVKVSYSGPKWALGQSYTATATAGRGYVFSNWVNGAGAVLTNDPVLKFTMRSNLTLVANFVPNPFIGKAGTFAGLFYSTNSDGVTVSNAGYFTATVATNGGFTAQIQQRGKTYSFSGQFGLDGRWQSSSVKAAAGLGMVFALDLAGGEAITGQIGNGTWISGLTAIQNPFTKAHPASLAGQYTVVIPASDPASTNLPGGYGALAVNVSPLGVVTVNGNLADGEPVTATAQLTQAGQWPLYVSLYGNSGIVLGWLSIANASTNNINGTIGWIKPTKTASKTYPQGWGYTTFDVIGSAFTNKVPVLNWTNGTVTLQGAHLSQDLSKPLAIGLANRVTTSAGLTLKLTTTGLNAGLFSGSVVIDSRTKASKTFSGALLQNHNAGYGWFVDTNQTGAVLLEGK